MKFCPRRVARASSGFTRALRDLAGYLILATVHDPCREEHRRECRRRDVGRDKRVVRRRLAERRPVRRRQRRTGRRRQVAASCVACGTPVVRLRPVGMS